MRIELLRQTSIAGRFVRVGDVVEAADPDARYLLATGSAKPAQESNPVVITPEPEARKPRTRKPQPVT